MAWEGKNVTLECRRAKCIDGAYSTLWPASDTRSPSMRDDDVIHVVPTVLWNKLHQGVFDLDGIRSIHHAKKIHNTCHMGINRNPGNVEAIGQNTVCGLSSNPGKRYELIETCRHRTTEFVNKALATAPNALGLVPIEARRVDITFKFFLRNKQVVLW